jgi:hypothetical protein
VVVSAKTEGVTPGFNIRDGRGDVYVIKFDPPGYLNMTTAAGVVSNRILHAAGYNVPDDNPVVFGREDIVVGDDAKIRGEHGRKRRMTEADIDTILARVEMLGENEWLAISSKYLSGVPIGPFAQHGTRDDDPNDRIKHENRRELRGLYVVAAWINHFDLKQHNSLDMYVTGTDGGFVRHYLIDFASTLGAGARGINRRYGYEFGFDPKAIMRRTFTLGFVEDRWRKRERDPELHEVGIFDSEYFEPDKFRPLQPNPLFANTTDRDAYWGAKVVGAFRDEHIDAAVAAGGYRDPRAAATVARVLKRNRDIIVRYYFDRVAPLDYFTTRQVAGGGIAYRDLGEEFGVYPGTTPRYRARYAVVDSDRNAARRSEWVETGETVLDPDDPERRAALASAPPDDRPFLEIELQVDRGNGWSGSVRVYIARASGRIVAVDR